MREKKQINGFIGLLKFICVNLIVIIHTGIILPGNTQRFLAGSYIYCDFLFIVMGFYGGFERKTDGNSGDTALDYLRKRLLQWFPLVFIETIIFLCVFVLKIVRENQGAEQFLGRFTGAIYDISFLRIFVPDAAGLNGTLWFLQAALFGGTIIYFIMPRNKSNVFQIAFWGAVAFIIYSAFYWNIGFFDDWWDRKILYIVQDGLPRGVAGISLGILLSKTCGYDAKVYWIAI